LFASIDGSAIRGQQSLMPDRGQRPVMPSRNVG
jgi:hypothetical protein